MNFLGHIFLTPDPDDDELLLGNFIGDSVKGNPDRGLPRAISRGVRLHREIDRFTDDHPLVRKGVERLRPSQGRFASVVIDVIYDHVLASNWRDFHEQRLLPYTVQVYERLERLQQFFPDRVKRYFPYMKEHNWLYNYQFEWGAVRALRDIDRRTNTRTEMYRSMEVFRAYEQEFRQEFSVFVADAQKRLFDYCSV